MNFFFENYELWVVVLGYYVFFVATHGHIASVHRFIKSRAR